MSDDIQMQAALQLLAGALQQEVSQIKPDAAIGVSERWDSLAHVRLVMALEEHIGRPLDTEAMLAIESLSDIVTFLAEA